MYQVGEEEVEVTLEENESSGDALPAAFQVWAEV